jgi:hypothetical protein
MTTLAAAGNASVVARRAAGRDRLHDDSGTDMDEDLAWPLARVEPGSPDTALPLPVILKNCGPAARFAFEDFLHGQIRNPHTRKAYLHAVRLFCGRCERAGSMWRRSRRRT